MKAFIFSLLCWIGILSTPAFAATTTRFGFATSCPTYCAGFTTDNPDVTIDFINANYSSTTTIISVNGVVYHGRSSYVVSSSSGDVRADGRVSELLETDVVLFAPDGVNSITATLQVTQTTRYVSRGRAHYYRTSYVVNGGSITPSSDSLFSAAQITLDFEGPTRVSGQPGELIQLDV